jgi:hypothetical protein
MRFLDRIWRNNNWPRSSASFAFGELEDSHEAANHHSTKAVKIRAELKCKPSQATPKCQNSLPIVFSTIVSNIFEPLKQIYYSQALRSHDPAIIMKRGCIQESHYNHWTGLQYTSGAASIRTEINWKVFLKNSFANFRFWKVCHWS